MSSDYMRNLVKDFRDKYKNDEMLIDKYACNERLTRCKRLASKPYRASFATETL